MFDTHNCVVNADSRKIIYLAHMLFQLFKIPTYPQAVLVLSRCITLISCTNNNIIDSFNLYNMMFIVCANLMLVELCSNISEP